MNLAPAVADLAPARASALLTKRGLAAALVFSAIFWLLAWYLDTAQSIVAIWERSDTFAHGYLILPISAWLIWRRRRDIAAIDLRPNFLILPLLALVGFGWLLGYLAGAGIVQQYGLVLMVPLLAWAILGNRLVHTLAFPLLFLLLAVPFGEFLEPPLMEHTANFTVLALRLSGIPVYREGQFFTIPSGSWSVVEACSGLRYLIASLTLGVLYAYLTYRSFSRRAIFIAASLLVPIVANWLRAYMVVMIGHLTSMQYAVGVDHLIYGWVFFGVVIFILFWVGSYWREDLDPQPARPDSSALAKPDEPPLAAMLAATIAAAAIVAVWPALAGRIAGTGPFPPPALKAPSAAGGWEAVPGRLTEWTPRFFNPRASINQAYAKDAKPAALYVAYYRNQHPGSQLITSQNTLVSSANNDWRNLGETRRPVPVDNGEIPSIEAQLRGQSNLLVWRWYWLDGHYTVNPYWAKLLQAKSKLFGRGDDGAVVIVYTEIGMEPDTEAAAGRLQDFVKAMLPGIAKSLENAR